MLLGCSYNLSQSIAIFCSGISSWLSTGLVYGRWSAVVPSDRSSPGYLCCKSQLCPGLGEKIDETFPLMKPIEHIAYNEEGGCSPSFSKDNYLRNGGKGALGSMGSPTSPNPLMFPNLKKIQTRNSREKTFVSKFYYSRSCTTEKVPAFFIYTF